MLISMTIVQVPGPSRVNDSDTGYQYTIGFKEGTSWKVLVCWVMIGFPLFDLSL